MNSILLGIVAAACWGTADFAARFSGRALGTVTALFGVCLAGTIGLALWLMTEGLSLPPLSELSWWLLGNGLTGIAGLFALYEGLRRGRVTIVVPLAGAFPAWALMALVAFEGVRPSGASWALMAATMTGVWIVARFSKEENAEAPADSKVVPIALAAGLLFGASIYMGQHASHLHGEVQTVLMARALGLALLLMPVLMLMRPKHLTKTNSRISPKWLAVLAIQGLLDTGGFLALMFAGLGEGGAVATVIGSTFGLITIALARLVLGETIRPLQGAGIALTFAGVAGLAGLN